MKQVITEYLKSVGADGLAKEGCGCGIEDGIIPCDNGPMMCVPAKKHIITQADLEDDSLNLCDPEIGDIVYIAMNQNNQRNEESSHD